VDKNDMANIFNSIETARLIPVIALDHADDAGPLGDALLAGGYRWPRSPSAPVRRRRRFAP